MNNAFIGVISREMNVELLAYGPSPHDSNWQEEMSKPFYDIWIIESGEVDVTLHDKTHHLQAGDMMFLYPRHLYKAHGNGKYCKFYYAQFNCFVGTHMHPLETLSLCDIYKSELLAKDNERFIYELKQHTLGNPMSAFALRGVIMQLISRAYHLKASCGEVSSMEVNDEKKLKFSKILGYINNNLENTISVSELAEKMFLSEKYFISYFKNIMGITPHQFIMQQRLKKAYHYINDETYTISEIARRLGYSDSYSFSKAYKKYFGFPPSLQTK